MERLDRGLGGLDSGLGKLDRGLGELDPGMDELVRGLVQLDPGTAGPVRGMSGPFRSKTRPWASHCWWRRRLKILASVSCGLFLATGAVYLTLPTFDFDEGIRRTVAFLALALLVVAVASTWAYVHSDARP